MSAEEIYPNADQADRHCHSQHIDGCSELHGKNPLEECHNQHHDDDFDDLVLEIIEVFDIKYAPEPALNPGDIDIRDEELVDTETEDDKDKTDQVKVHSTDDSDQDLLMGERVLCNLNKSDKNMSRSLQNRQ